jgi:hypothetical protein
MRASGKLQLIALGVLLAVTAFAQPPPAPDQIREGLIIPHTLSNQGGAAATLPSGCPANQWLTSVLSDSFTCVQPACGNLSNSSNGCGTQFQEGTWTPQLIGTTGGSGTMTANTMGTYMSYRTPDGYWWAWTNLVAGWSAFTGTGYLAISGMPVTQENIPNHYYANQFAEYDGLNAINPSYTIFSMETQPGSSTIYVYTSGPGKQAPLAQLPVAQVSATGEIRGQLFFKVAGL